MGGGGRFAGGRAWGGDKGTSQSIRSRLSKKASSLRFLDYAGAGEKGRKRTKNARKGRDFQEGWSDTS